MARGPGFLLAAACLGLVAVAIATGFFAGLRTLYSPLPYREPDQLVSCYQIHFLAASWGVQARYVHPWQERSKLLSDVAAYQVRVFRLSRPGYADANIDGARVAPNFFSLLGVVPRLGRSFEPQDSAANPPVLLSEELWRRRFGSDPSMIGSQITLDGQTSRVVGILPANFWFKNRDLAIWTLLPDFSRPIPELRLVGTVGRLAPGATAMAARAELERIDWRNNGFRGAALRVVPLAQSLRPSFQLILLAGGVALLFSLAMALHQPWRSWLFFLAKVTLLAGLLAAVLAEVAARNALALYPYKLWVSLFVDWSSVLGVMLLLRWAVVDQSRRCPVCLRHLAMPSTSGSWSSALLSPPSTELLCDQGHGALSITESGTARGETRLWIATDDSWRELFAASRK